MDWVYDKLVMLAGMTREAANEQLEEEVVGLLNENLKIWQSCGVVGLDTYGYVCWVKGMDGMISFQLEGEEDDESEEGSQDYSSDGGS